MPIGQIEFGLGAVDDGLVKGDGEADGGVLDLVVVGVVVHEAAKIVGVELEVIEEGFGQAGFVIISLRRARQGIEERWGSRFVAAVELESRIFSKEGV